MEEYSNSEKAGGTLIAALDSYLNHDSILNQIQKGWGVSYWTAPSRQERDNFSTVRQNLTAAMVYYCAT